MCIRDRSYTASVSVKSIKSLERAALLLEDFFLKINLEYYAPVLSLAKVYVKVHSMKSSFYNEEAFRYSISLFPNISGGDKTKIGMKDRLLLFLLDTKMIALLRLYIKVGLHVSSRW